MSNTKKQLKIYLIFVLGICWILGVAAIFTRGNCRNILYQILQKGFTALPVIAAIFTRRITKDKAGWRISLKVWKNLKLWGFCAFVPGVLIVVGALLYFMLFPEQYSGVFDIGSVIGTEQVIRVNSPFQFSLICVLIAALCVPIQLLELGEEIGWREYLLPKQIAVYFGFNYSSDNAGAPWSNMLMMMLVCVTIGIICSYVMVCSGNVMYSAIIHGVVNVIGEIPVFVSVSGKNGLLGPNPTGLISMSGLILCAIIMLMKLPTVRRMSNYEKDGF